MLTACKKQTLMTYNSDNSIYFAQSVLPRAPFDSTAISFAFAGGTGTDSTLQIIIAVTGAPTAHDRPYTLVVDNTVSTAKAGTHYVAPAAAQSIKAGKLSDTIPLKLLRTADMLTNEFKIVLRVKANENFNTAMEYKMLSATQRLHYTRYTVYVNDIIRKPGRWLDTYMGTFTRKKLFLTCDLLNTTPAYMDVPASVADMVFYGTFMQRYLNQMKAAGNTIYEEDGSAMIMGPSVQ